MSIRHTKYYLILILGAILCIFSTNFCNSFAEEEPSSGNQDWIKRIDLGIEAGTGQKPKLYFETVQPLYQNSAEDKTLFIQPRVNKQDDDETLNLGIGYRWLTRNENILLGMNTFYDHTYEHDHYRAGFGIEALGKILEARVNTYWGLSDKRIVEETGTSTTYEEVVDGFDVEVGGAIIPRLHWLKLYGSTYWFDHKKFDDKEGWRVRTRIEPTDTINCDVTLWDDNKGDMEVRVDVAVNIEFDGWADIRDTFRIAKTNYEDKDLSESMLIPVERDHEVKVEKWIESSGLTIEVGRQ